MSHYAPISIDEFKEAMPHHVRKNVNQGLVDQVNKAISDPEALAVFRENVLGLTTVMKEGRFKIVDYLYAVKFVSHRLLGDSQTQAWVKTFPDRYQKMLARQAPAKDIGAVASRYNSSKLVTLMMAQTMVPTHILNAPLYQEAINCQANLMRTAQSEKVRCEAAANLLATLKPPEVQKVELDIGIHEDSGIKELRMETMKLARMQKEMIENGSFSPRTVAESKLIDVTPDTAANDG